MTTISLGFSINNDEYKESIMYNELMDFIKRNEENEDIVWRFKWIVIHQGPFIHTDPNCKGSKYNVLMEWENGEITEEPLAIIEADNPVTCAIYAKEKGLLDKNGWKCFKRITNQEKHFLWLVWQAKLKSFWHAPK